MADEKSEHVDSVYLGQMTVQEVGRTFEKNPPRPMSTEELLTNWFSYHPPIQDQAQRYAALRQAGLEMAKRIVELCPVSGDRDAAIRHVRDAVYSANASIACGGK